MKDSLDSQIPSSAIVTFTLATVVMVTMLMAMS